MSLCTSCLLWFSWSCCAFKRRKCFRRRSQVLCFAAIALFSLALQAALLRLEDSAGQSPTAIVLVPGQPALGHPSEGSQPLLRRSKLLAGIVCATAGGLSCAGHAESAAPSRGGPVGEGLVVPLRYCGGGFCLEFSIDGRLYRAVVDTGSPFATVSTCQGDATSGGLCASYCRAWGCAPPALGSPASLNDSTVFYAAGRAEVTWRRVGLSLAGTSLGQVIVGVVGSVVSMSGNGGGTFFGLIADAPQSQGGALAPPSLLGQTRYRTLSVRLVPGAEQFALSPDPVVEPDAIPLVDLRPYGAPLLYYAVEVKSLKVGGEEIAADDGGLGRLVAVIDTGTTGLALPEELFEVFDTARRLQRRRLGRNASNSISITLSTEAGGSVVLDLRRGNVPAYGEAFDIVTPIPQDNEMGADAAALWAGDDIGDPAGLKVDGRIARLAGPAAATVRGVGAVGRGSSFSVRVRRCSEMPDGTCDGIAVGLAPYPLRGVLGEADASCAYTAGGRTLAAGVEAAAAGGAPISSGPKLRVGDVVECGLDDEGEPMWRINGARVNAPRLATTRTVFPAVSISSGTEIELLTGGGGAFAAPARAGPRPQVIFMGLGFLLGREVRIDAASRRAVFSTA